MTAPPRANLQRDPFERVAIDWVLYIFPLPFSPPISASTVADQKLPVRIYARDRRSRGRALAPILPAPSCPPSARFVPSSATRGLRFRHVASSRASGVVANKGQNGHRNLCPSGHLHLVSPFHSCPSPARFLFPRASAVRRPHTIPPISSPRSSRARVYTRRRPMLRPISP